MTDPGLLGCSNDGEPTSSLLGSTIRTSSAIVPEGTATTAIIEHHLSSSDPAIATATVLNGPVVVTSSTVPQTTRKVPVEEPQTSVIASSLIGTARTSIVQVQPEATGVISSQEVKQSTATFNQGATASILMPAATSVIQSEAHNVISSVNNQDINGGTSSLVAAQGTSTGSVAALAITSSSINPIQTVSAT